MTVPQENIQAQPEQRQADLEKNFAVQRRHYEKELEKQRQDFEQQLQAANQQRQVKQDDDSDNDSEPYIDEKRLKKHLSRFEQTIDQKIDKKAEEKARFLVEQERQNNYLRQNNDFNQILSAENIQKFAEKYPDIAEPMLEMPDGFSRQKLLYQQIKALGVHKPPEVKPSIQEVIDKNRRSPFYSPSDMSGAPPYANNGDFSAVGKKNAYDKMKSLINNRRALS